MSHSRRRIVSAAALALLCAGCGSGNLVSSETNQASSREDGVNLVRHGMYVRNAFVLGPERGQRIARGAYARVYLVLVSHDRGDRLIGASATGAARTVRISRGSLPVPRGREVKVGARPWIMLEKLTHPLTGTRNVALRLRFAHAGTITMSLPVLVRTGEYATLPPGPTPAARVTPRAKAGQGSATPTPRASATSRHAHASRTGSEVSGTRAGASHGNGDHVHHAAAPGAPGH